MLREKQQNNPEFAFLFGGPDHAYYQWRTWCMRNGWTEEQVEKESQHFYPAMGPTTEDRRDMEKIGVSGLDTVAEAEFIALLDGVNGSKESIKSTRKWIVDKSVGHESRIAEIIAGRMLALQGAPFERKLWLVYLLNDIAHAFSKKRVNKSEVDQFCAGLGPHLLAIFDTAFRGHPPDDQDKVVKVVRLWGQREIYPDAVVKDLETKMRSEATVPHYPSAASIPIRMPVPHPAPYFPSSPVLFPAPVLAHRPSAFPLVPPTSTLHLGPGFIVTLTKDLASYQPLDPLKVPSHIPPEFITPPDAYTLSRLDKFYAEINAEPRDKRKRRRSRSRSRSRSPRKKRSRSRSPGPPASSKTFATIPPPLSTRK